MLEIKTQFLFDIPPALLDAYAKLQIPIFKSMPHSFDLSTPVGRNLLAIAALDDSQPAGLILSSLTPSEFSAEIQSVFVLEPYRKQGVATRMIEYLAEELKKRNFKLLAFTYPDRMQETPIIERLLKKTGFEGKKMVLAEFQFDYLHFAPPWFVRKYNWPKDYQVFPWNELTFEDMNKIIYKFKSRNIPEVVFPFQEGAQFDPLNSLGLRHRGEVIGWVITSRIRPDKLCYDSIYIDQEYQFKGLSIQLLADSIRIHVENKVKWGIFKVNINEASSRWLLFIRHRLAPYADYIFEYYQAVRLLKKEPGVSRMDKWAI